MHQTKAPTALFLKSYSNCITVQYNNGRKAVIVASHMVQAPILENIRNVANQVIQAFGVSVINMGRVVVSHIVQNKTISVSIIST